jgi:hypothetical protein
MAIAELHRAETELAEEYAKVAERHAAEHDVHHLRRLYLPGEVAHDPHQGGVAADPDGRVTTAPASR